MNQWNRTMLWISTHRVHIIEDHIFRWQQILRHPAIEDRGRNHRLVHQSVYCLLPPPSRSSSRSSPWQGRSLPRPGRTSMSCSWTFNVGRCTWLWYNQFMIRDWTSHIPESNATNIFKKKMWLVTYLRAIWQFIVVDEHCICNWQAKSSMRPEIFEAKQPEII